MSRLRSRPIGRIERHFSPKMLDGVPRRKTALLINPPIYDTQYWAEWSQPYGLLRIASLLKKYRYGHIDFFDFMETAPPASPGVSGGENKRSVPRHRIHFDESYTEQDGPVSGARPYVIEKNGDALVLYKHHFGKSWSQFERWVKAKGFARHPPHEIYVSSVMSYWWESTRDLICRLRRLIGSKPTIIIGGIYPSIAPEHAARYTGADIVVAGEVIEANELWTDLSVYRRKPDYAIITPSRGCPYNCHYCAAKTINGGRQVRFRPVNDIFEEMLHKHDRYGIRDFAFYADFLLLRHQENLMPLLRKIVDAKLAWRLYAPEGLDTRFLSQSQELCDLLKASQFQKIYLPVENIDDDILVSLNRKHVKLHHVTKAAENIGRAGYRMRHQNVSGYCLYGLPGERIENVVQTALFVSDTIGSVIPMLFAPVPSTEMFEQYRDYFRERGWCAADGHVRDLHLLNGKLFPFIHMNEGTPSDYMDLQRMMFMLNESYRSKSFSIFGGGAVAEAFRQTITDFQVERAEAALARSRLSGWNAPGVDDVLTDKEEPHLPPELRN